MRLLKVISNMRDYIARIFNKKGLLEQIIIENEEKIAYEIALKNNDLSIYRNYKDLFELHCLDDSRIIGFTIRLYKNVNKDMIKTIRSNAALIDFSFMTADFRAVFRVSTCPKVVDVYIAESYIDYRFAVPFLDISSDNIVNELLTKK